MAQSEIVQLTGKSKAEISRFLALHGKVVPEDQEAARSGSEILIICYLYNISKLKPDQPQAIADQVTIHHTTLRCR